MIAIVSRPEILKTIVQLNRRGTWELETIATSPASGIIKALEQSGAYTHIIFDIEAIKGNIDSALDIIERLSKTTTAKIVVVGIGFEKGGIIDRDVISIGIPDNRIVFAGNNTELKARLAELLPKPEVTAAQPVREEEMVSPDEPQEPQVQPTLSEVAAIPSKADRSALKGFQIRKPITKTTKAITVGVAGAGSRMGTTTQALQIVHYLKALDYSAAVIELNEQHHLKSMIEQGAFKIIDDNHFMLNGVDVYSSSRAILEAKQNFNYVICDYGDFRAVPDIMSYLDKDVKVMCCGIKPWESEILIDSVFDTDDGSINYLFSFVPQNEEPLVIEQMDDAAKRTYFAKWAADMFCYCGDDKTYKSILSGNLVEKEAAAKSSGFNLFHKKGVLK